MSAKSVLLLFTVFTVFLMPMSVLACGGGESSDRGGSTKSSAPLALLPDDTSRLEALNVSEILGGGVPENFEQQFEAQWEPYSLGDDIVTIDDVDSLVRAITKDGEILMLSGSQMDFAGIRDWLTSEEASAERTSYQGEELWGGGSRAMILLDGYLIQGDAEALKTVLKIKARGKGSLDKASENSLKKAYEDARSGWYVLASETCGEFSDILRSCEAYSITGGQGKEDYLVDVTYRFMFRSEQRADDQALDIEDWLDDRGWDVDLEEVKADGTSVEAKASGDEGDFRTEWLVSYSGISRPAPLTGTSPETDREALVALFNATGGPNWTYNTNWLSDAPIGQWPGVSTNDDGRVIGLDLDENQLRGEIPPELGNLASLITLDLGLNELSGAIPPELGNLASLTTLSLWDNRLSGAIPPELGNLANLERLSLGGNQLLSGEIPPELGNLANLTRLYLWNNRLSGEIPPELGNLASLTSLNLGGNQLSGEIPSELGSLANLTVLDLADNQLCVPSSLQGSPLPWRDGRPPNCP